MGSYTLGLNSITHLEIKAGTEQVKFLRDITSQIFKASNVILSIDSNKGFLEDYLNQDVLNAPSNSNASDAAR